MRTIMASLSMKEFLNSFLSFTTIGVEHVLFMKQVIACLVIVIGMPFEYISFSCFLIFSQHVALLFSLSVRLNKLRMQMGKNNRGQS